MSLPTDTGEFWIHSLEQRIRVLNNVRMGFFGPDLEHCLSELDFDQVDHLVNRRLLPLPRVSQEFVTRVFMLSFAETVSTPQVENIVDSEKLQLLPWTHFLELCNDKRSWDFNSLVCLTIQIENTGFCPAMRQVPIVHNFSNEERVISGFYRVLDLARIGQLWPQHTIFPAVAKGVLSE